MSVALSYIHVTDFAVDQQIRRLNRMAGLPQW